MRLNKITYKNKKLLNSSIQRNIFHSHFDIHFNYFVKNKLSINFQFQILKFLINLHSNKIRLIIFLNLYKKTFINKIFIIIVFVSIKSFYSIFSILFKTNYQWEHAHQNNKLRSIIFFLERLLKKISLTRN